MPKYVLNKRRRF